MIFTFIHSLLSYKEYAHKIDPLTSCLELVGAEIQTYPSEQSVNWVTFEGEIHYDDTIWSHL